MPLRYPRRKYNHHGGLRDTGVLRSRTAMKIIEVHRKPKYVRDGVDFGDFWLNNLELGKLFDILRYELSQACGNRACKCQASVTNT